MYIPDWRRRSIIHLAGSLRRLFTVNVSQRRERLCPCVGVSAVLWAWEMGSIFGSWRLKGLVCTAVGNSVWCWSVRVDLQGVSRWCSWISELHCRVASSAFAHLYCDVFSKYIPRLHLLCLSWSVLLPLDRLYTETFPAVFLIGSGFICGGGTWWQGALPSITWKLATKQQCFYCVMHKLCAQSKHAHRTRHCYLEKQTERKQSSNINYK